jgi:uncharacterized protein YqeY
MSLKEKINADMKAAMKSRDRLRLETLRTLRAALTEKEIERRGETAGMTGEDEVAVLVSAAKRRRESIEQFEKGGRKDLVEQESRELAIIQEYLPRPMDANELEALIREVAAASGASSPGDFGKLMPAVMKLAKGKADGKLVQELVRKHLGAG